MGTKQIAAALVILLGAGLATPAAAQSKSAAVAPGGGVPELLGKFGDWAAYVSQTPKTRICYALSQPKDRQPASLKRDPGFLFISHRPGEGVRNEVSAMMGFPLKEGDAALQVGNVVFAMTTKDDNVWIKNPAEEQRLIDTMRRGKDLVIKGTSRRGNASTDRYSLSGLAQALDRVAQDCK
jgi:invasion protein IalB